MRRSVADPTKHRGHHRPHFVRSGLIAAAVLGLLLVTTMTRHVPFWPDHGRTVDVMLASGINLNGTTPVRVRGVEVGRVETVRANPAGRGVVATLRLTDDDLVLHQDASARVHYRTLLGLNMSVDIAPGSPSAAPLGDRPIRLSKTYVQPEIDEVLQPLDAAGRTAVQTAAREFDRAFARPAQAAAAIETLAPGLRAVGRGLPGLRGTAPGVDLPELVRSAATAMGALSRDEVVLGDLITNADVTLGVTAARGGDIAETLRRAPGALDVTRRTMARLTATLDTLDPLARQLLPGVRELAPTLTAVRGALHEATPLLDDARPTLRELAPTTRILRNDVAVPGRRLVAALLPAVDRVKDSVLPFLNARDSETHMPNYQAIGPTIAHADSLTSHFDAYGHSIVFEPSAGTHLVKGADCTSAFVDANESELLACRSTLAVLGKLFGGMNLGQKRSGR